MKIWFAFLCISLLALSGCSPSSGSGGQYIRDLSALIERADRIEMVEHSSPRDFYTPETGKQAQTQEKIYQRVVLTAAQKKGVRNCDQLVECQDAGSLPRLHRRAASPD